MSFKVNFSIQEKITETSNSPIEKTLPPQAENPTPVFGNTKIYDAQLTGGILKNQLDKKLTFNTVKSGADQTEPKSPDVSKDSPRRQKIDKLQAQQNKAAVELFILQTNTSNSKISLKNSRLSPADKSLITASISKSEKRIETLKNELEIRQPYINALKSGDKKSIAFFEAAEKTNKTGDPWDMNPGDAFRNSLTPKAQKQYDETLAKLRNDPRVKFEFKKGTIDTLAMRETALRGMVAATFGRPHDLEQRIKDGADASKNGKYTITYVPNDYKSPDGNDAWGSRASKTGIEAKQGFVLRQIEHNKNNVFIHEFSHTLEFNSDDKPENLPPDFGLINKLRFYAAFNDPKFQAYLHKNKINVETFSMVQSRFRLNPQELKKASPEMYRIMVDYSNFDPLTGSLK